MHPLHDLYTIVSLNLPGREVLERISPRIEALRGVLSDGLRTKGHPTAIAGATL
jgi:hypothetical protein